MLIQFINDKYASLEIHNKNECNVNKAKNSQLVFKGYLLIRVLNVLCVNKITFFSNTINFRNLILGI